MQIEPRIAAALISACGSSAAVLVHQLLERIAGRKPKSKPQPAQGAQRRQNRNRRNRKQSRKPIR